MAVISREKLPPPTYRNTGLLVIGNDAVKESFLLLKLNAAIRDGVMFCYGITLLVLSRWKFPLPGARAGLARRHHADRRAFLWCSRLLGATAPIAAPFRSLAARVSRSSQFSRFWRISRVSQRWPPLYGQSGTDKMH